MNKTKNDYFQNVKLEKGTFKKLPYIQKKINPIRTLLESSSQSYSTLVPKNTNFYFYPRRSQGLPKEKINTKLYKVNDYISMKNKNINSFNNINSINRTRNKKEINNSKNNRSDIKQDIGKTYTHLYRNSSTGNYNISTATSQNNKFNLNLFNNKSNILYNDSTSNNQTTNNYIMHNKNNNDIIKKLNNYNLNLLKNSKYFSKTKYINGIKNKIHNQKHINKSLSTKNISLENNYNASTRKTINDMAMEKLLIKHHRSIDEYKNIKNEDDTLTKRMEEIGIGTTDPAKANNVNNAIFYDFIPIILQHMKQKETLEEINKEQENNWLFDKIKSVYNNNSTEMTKGNITSHKKNILENPIIKYLFLERTLYNLRHTVNFVNIENREEFEEKVLKVMEEEYNKLENNQNIYYIHDFITYGFEFDPKMFFNLKQLNINLKNRLLLDSDKVHKESKKIKGEEPNFSLTHHKARTRGFFTTNKSDFKLDENKNNNDSNDKSSFEIGSLLNKIMSANKIATKIRKFEGLKKSEKNLPIIKNLEEDKDKDKTIIVQKEDTEEKDVVGNIYLDTNNLAPNIGISRLAQELLDDETKDKNYNTIKDNEKFNPNRNHIDLTDVTHLVNDVQTKDKIKKRNGNKYFKMYSVKKKKPKKKKKVEKPKSIEEEKKEEPKVDFDLIKSTVPVPKPIEIKKEQPKIEIKNKFDYERYKKEKIKEIELDKKSKSKLFATLKRQDIKRASKKKNSMLNEIYYSSDINKNNEDGYEKGKIFQKIKKIEEKKNEGEEEEEDIITQLKKLKKAEKEKEGVEESESSVYSSDDDEEMDEIDMSKDMENNGEVIKKKWMENSPKFKNRIIDFNKRRFAISNESHQMFDEFIRNEKIEMLSDKMKKLYDKIEKKRKSDSKRKKKKRPYSFTGTDLSSVEEIEKKKKIFLNRIKEDIKYKINEGKYHRIEMDNFKNFEEAMNKFKLKNASDIKKVKLYINLVEKYLHFYQMELDKKEKEKMDEDRINRFLRNLNQEIYVTLPYVKDVKGRHCHSVDYFKELQELSEYHGFF